MINFYMKQLTILFLLFLTSWSGLFAQKKKNTPKDSVYAAQPVTVTATRQAQKTLDVPLAVTIVSPLDLQNKRGFGLDEVLSMVPGALVQARTGNHDVRITIRGYGARGAGERSNAGTSRGIRVLVDGIPQTEPDGRTAFDLIDITGASSIEVLRSNASALWGNASGGIVNISSIPVSNVPFVSAQTQLGSFGMMKNSLQAGTTSDLGKMYVSFNNTTFDGWRNHSSSAITQFNLGIVSQVNLRTKLGVFMAAASNIFRIAGPLTQAQFDSNAQQAQTISPANFVARDERRFNRLGSMGVTLDHAIGDNHTITSMAFIQPKFLQRSERNTFRDFTRYHVGGNVIYKNFGKISDEIGSHFIAGVDNQYQDGAIQFYYLTSGARDSLRTSKREGANNFGLFVQEELSFGEKFSAVLSARFDKITYYNETLFDNGKPLNLVAEKTYQNTTPKLGLMYRLADNMSVYANLGGGIEVPAGNETDPPASLASFVINPLLEPIRSTTYELGWKALPQVDDFLGMGSAAVSLDVAAYWIQITNDIIPYSGGRFYFSAGRTRRVGAELGGSMRIENGLTLSTAITYANNKYIEYKIDSLVEGNVTGAANKDYSNNKSAGLPDMFATIRAKYQPTFFDKLSIDAEMRTVGGYFADDANLLPVNSYLVFDAGISYEQEITGGLSVRGFVRGLNLFDEKYAASVWINPDDSGAKAAFLEAGLPRNFSAGINLTWRGE
jgi:iron complex outermembrane receptor protein